MKTTTQPEGLLITELVPDSIATEVGLEPGDRLLAINGQPLRDIIDYHYYADEPELLLEIAKVDGEIWEVEVEREPGESLGFGFAPPIPRHCGNACQFCFVDQLPAGLRAPLSVKDEDYRLSFLYGNYVTLTNLKRQDLERIKEQRLSPLYISVHATDPAVRDSLLGRRRLPALLPLLQELAAAGITLHTQVVLCPGINDAACLERTVADLAALFPAVASLAVVPVGLTTHRQGLPELSPVTPDYARQFVACWQPRAMALATELGTPFLFLADEFYLLAEAEFPPLAAYGDLPQLENGVGLVPLFRHEAAAVLDEVTRLGSGRVLLVTGVSFAAELAAFADQLAKQSGLQLQVVPVANRLFGSSVTVTGLVAGADIRAALAEMSADLVLIPEVMFRDGDGLFLDDWTLADLVAACGLRAIAIPSTPAGIWQALLENFPPTVNR